MKVDLIIGFLNKFCIYKKLTQVTSKFALAPGGMSSATLQQLVKRTSDAQLHAVRKSGPPGALLRAKGKLPLGGATWATADLFDVSERNVESGNAYTQKQRYGHRYIFTTASAYFEFTPPRDPGGGSYNQHDGSQPDPHKFSWTGLGALTQLTQLGAMWPPPWPAQQAAFLIAENGLSVGVKKGPERALRGPGHRPAGLSGAHQPRHSTFRNRPVALRAPIM